MGRPPFGAGSAPTSAPAGPKSIAGLCTAATLVTAAPPPFVAYPAVLSRWKSSAPELTNSGSATALPYQFVFTRCKSDSFSISDPIVPFQITLRVPESGTFAVPTMISFPLRMQPCTLVTTPTASCNAVELYEISTEF